MTLGNTIKALRKERGISQKGLAIKLNFAQSAVSDWEADRKVPMLKTVIEMADIFGVTIDYIVGRTTTPEVVKTGITPKDLPTPFEASILSAYRSLSPAEQAMICRQLGIVHPADSRANIKNA